MWIIITVIALAILVFKLVFRHPVFGGYPRGSRLERMKKSIHYNNGKFHNLSPTSTFSEGYTARQVGYDFFFKKDKNNKPHQKIPTLKTNLHQLDRNIEAFVWFGHSSYFLQTNGLRFLVDPVFSKSASPLPGGTLAFKGSSVYSVEDMPEIDFLLITHDHYDHLDYKTIKKLEPKVKCTISGLGVGAHIRRWGYRRNKIHEMDWWKTLLISEKTYITATPARHFSGRKWNRNTTLWTSFVIQTPYKTFFLGGDSGYDTHFKEIGNRFGPFDLAILENGQYNKAWSHIHLLPEQVPMAIKDLQAKKTIPVHSGKFALALHAWNEPLELIYQNAVQENLLIQTPKIGELLATDDEFRVNEKWWDF